MSEMLALLDRDGVLVEDRPDYVKSPAELRFLPGAAAGVARLNRAGWKVVGCTNQSCVGRGIVSVEMLARIHETLFEGLRREGARIDDLFFAPDAPWAATDRRKPGPGMLREALAKYRTPPDRAAMVGDHLVDLQAATRAGVRRMLVRTGRGRRTLADGVPPDVLPVEVCEDLGDAVDRLLGEGGK